MEEELVELKIIVEKLVNGDCFSPIDIEKFTETKELAQQLQQLQSIMASQTFEIQVASAQVASASEKIETYFHQQTKKNHAIHQQASDISDINQQNLSMINQTVKEANEAVDVIVQSSDSTRQLAQIGQVSQKDIKTQTNKIINVVEHIQSIAESTQKTDALLKALQKSSTKISSIVDTVQLFSKQTRLVSMNASIEAARSGEAGKGFAVIADEISRLSEESNSSVNGIYDLIEELRQTIKDVTLCNQENQKNVKETVQQSNEVNYGLNHIEETYNTVLSHIDSIAEMSLQSRSFFKEVELTVKETASGVDEMANGFERLQQEIAEQFNRNLEIQQLKVRLTEAAHGLEIVSAHTNEDAFSANEEQIKLLKETMQQELEQLANDPTLSSLDAQVHQQIIDDWIDKHHEIDALWSNDADGNFIYSNPPSGIDNAKIRNWFNQGIQGKHYTSMVYISAISKKPCITISAPIINGNRIVGVVGADIDLKR